LRGEASEPNLQNLQELAATERNSRRTRFWHLLFTLTWILGTAVAVSSADLPVDLTEQHLNDVVRDFRGRLRITPPVSVSIVAANQYLVSVEQASRPQKGFIIKFDREFLPTLEEQELRAVIAHELGHIWIFTHHPYLQTEPLANEKAMQLVDRESLEKVYKKVWQFEGQKGSLEEFLAKVE